MAHALRRRGNLKTRNDPPPIHSLRWDWTGNGAPRLDRAAIRRKAPGREASPRLSRGSPLFGSPRFAYLGPSGCGVEYPRAVALEPTWSRHGPWTEQPSGLASLCLLLAPPNFAHHALPRARASESESEGTSRLTMVIELRPVGGRLVGEPLSLPLTRTRAHARPRREVRVPPLSAAMEVGLGRGPGAVARDGRRRGLSTGACKALDRPLRGRPDEFRVGTWTPYPGAVGSIPVTATA